MRGLRQEPLAPRLMPGLSGLRGISCAASAGYGWIGRPWHAGRLGGRYARLLESAIRAKSIPVVVAVEPLAPWRSDGAYRPTAYGSPRGFHERSIHIRVEMISRHTSGVVVDASELKTECRLQRV